MLLVISTVLVIRGSTRLRIQKHRSTLQWYLIQFSLQLSFVLRIFSVLFLLVLEVKSLSVQLSYGRHQRNYFFLAFNLITLFRPDKVQVWCLNSGLSSAMYVVKKSENRFKMSSQHVNLPDLLIDMSATNQSQSI